MVCSPHCLLSEGIFHYSQRQTGKNVPVEEGQGMGHSQPRHFSFLYSHNVYFEMLQGGGFSTVILLDFLSQYHPLPHVAAQSSNILWYVPGLNYLCAFQCPPSGLGLLTKPHHVAAALLLCRALLHVHSIWTFPLMEAFPESECV